MGSLNKLNSLKIILDFIFNCQFLEAALIGVTSLRQLNENLSSININFNEEMMRDVQNIHLSDPNPCY